MHTFFDQYSALREARLVARHFTGTGLPGEAFRGFHGPQPGLPNMRLGQHGFHRGFHGGLNRGFGFQNRVAWHVRHNAQNRFWYWNEQSPTWFHWRYERPVTHMVDHPTAESTRHFRNGALQNMRGMERYRFDALDRANGSLRDVGMEVPLEYAANANLGYLASRMGFIDPLSFEDRFGYPALFGPRRVNPTNLPPPHGIYRRAQVERWMGAARHMALLNLRQEYANVQEADHEIVALEDTLQRWDGMDPEEQGDAYLQSLLAARSHMDVRPFQRQFLEMAGNQDPRTWRQPRLQG